MLFKVLVPKESRNVKFKILSPLNFHLAPYLFSIYLLHFPSWAAGHVTINARDFTCSCASLSICMINQWVNKSYLANAIPECS